MKPPKTIKVCGVIYNLDYKSEDFFTTQGCYGACCSKSRVISIWDGARSLDIGDILIHEILHACNDFAAIDDQSSEEDFARRTGSTLWTVLFVDNPKLLRYLSWLGKQPY